MKRSALLFSTCLISFSGAAFAEEVTPLIEGQTPVIVVTPTRQATPLNQIASSVTVIDAAEIARKNKPTVIELLREVPGVTLANSGGRGQSTRLFMRGTNSNHVLVMIDGVAVNDPSDPATAYDFSNLTTDNIERIEVLRGPQSTLYGSQAIGGVINIFTREGSGAPKVTGFAEYGRYHSRKEGIGFSGSTGGTSYSFAAGESHTDGISAFDKRDGGREKDGNTMYTLSAKVSSKLTENFTAKFNARYNQSATDFDSVGSIPAFGLRPDDDLAPRGHARQLNTRIAGEYSAFDGKWKQELGVSTVYFNRDAISEYFDAFFTPYFGSQQYIGRRDTVDWVHHLNFFDHHAINIGAELYSDHYKQISPQNGFPEVNVDNRAFFADDQITYGNAFMNIGARIDDHQAFGRQFTWKVAPGYNIEATGTTLKASYGTGFKAPSLAQLYDIVSGAPGLGPEKSKGWDAGFEQKAFDNKLTFGATYFRNDIDDLIGFGPAPTFAIMNMGKARTQGVESTVRITPLADLSISANHTYTLSLNQSRDTELLRRPKHMWNVSSVYQYSDAGDIGLDITHAGISRDFDYASFTGALTDLKAYTVVGLTTNYKINQNYSVYGRLDNVLDKRYEQISGFGQPGVGLYAGVKVSY